MAETLNDFDSYLADPHQIGVGVAGRGGEMRLATIQAAAVRLNPVKRVVPRELAEKLFDQFRRDGCTFFKTEHAPRQANAVTTLREMHDLLKLLEHDDLAVLVAQEADTLIAPGPDDAEPLVCSEITDEQAAAVLEGMCED